MKTLALNNRQKQILKILAPQLKSVGRSKIWIILMLMFILAGAVGLYMQIAEGQIVTGMRDHVVWGYYTANFIYFIGVSYAAAMLAGILYLFKISWGRPVIRIASLLAFISGIIGPVYILLCMGRFDRLHYLFFYARVQSPITWEVMVVSTYLVGISLFLYLQLIKDFAVLRDTKLIQYPNWRKKLYRILSLGFRWNPTQNSIINHSTRSMAFIMLPKVILAFAVLSWIFGMTLRPGWSSTIFGPTFIISSLATSVSMIICILWGYRKIYKLEDFITEEHFRKLGFILLAVISIYAYFTFSEYITTWYSSGKWEMAVMYKSLSFNEYGWLFHLSNLLGIILPIIIIGFRKFRTTNLITLVAMLLVFSTWAKRYLTVIPPQETPLLPIQDTRAEYLHYTATWVEWALVFAGSATFLLYFIWVSKLVNIIPVSDYGNQENKH